METDDTPIRVLDIHYRPSRVRVVWRDGALKHTCTCLVSGGVFAYEEIADLPWPVFAALAQVVPEPVLPQRWV